jgi:multiple sugar transport system substrate-binding protein
MIENNKRQSRTVSCYVFAFMAILVFSLPAVVSATTLEIWDWWSPTVMGQAISTWWDHVEERFEKENPGVNVEIMFVTGMPTKLITAVAAGVGPDVTQISVSYARDLYESGMLMPLNDFVSKTPSLSQDQFFPFARLFNSKDGVIYAVPHNVDNNSLHYDIDAFHEAGLDADPLAIASWDMFRDYVRKLTRFSDTGQVVRAGYDTTIGTVSFQNWLYANGGDFYNKTHDGFLFAGPHGVEALEFLLELRSHGQQAPAGTGLVFASRRAAIVLESGYGTRIVAENPDMNFGMTSLPPGPRGSARAVTGWVNMLAIPTGAKNPELAWEWIKYFAGLEGQLKFFEVYGRAGIPRLDFFRTRAWSNFVREHPFIRMLPHLLESAREYPFVKYRDINSILTTNVFNAIGRGVAPQAGLEEAQRLGNLLFAE